MPRNTTASRSRSGSRSKSTAAKQSRGKAPTRRATTTRTRTQDCIALLKADHREVEQLFKRYERLGENAVKTKRQICDKLVKELSVHAAIEEQILYPTVDEEVPRGEGMVGHSMEEHQEVKQLLARLQDLEPESPEFDPLMKKLMEVVRDHVEEEEHDIFPKLRQTLNRASLVKMGELMRMAKKTAPTRPHPNAPATPPANVIVGMAAGLVDRAKDALRGNR